MSGFFTTLYHILSFSPCTSFLHLLSAFLTMNQFLSSSLFSSPLVSFFLNVSVSSPLVRFLYHAPVLLKASPFPIPCVSFFTLRQFSLSVLFIPCQFSSPVSTLFTKCAFNLPQVNFCTLFQFSYLISVFFIQFQFFLTSFKFSLSTFSSLTSFQFSLANFCFLGVLLFCTTCMLSLSWVSFSEK
jgi:hypothetical protein